jgi:iron complex outermembrane receptor protein
LRQRTTEAARRDNLLFFIGERDFDVSQSVTAAFAELRLPVLTGLEIQAAARYENYGNNVNSFDPKIAMSWRPIEQLLLRASYGTSFSAPTLFQSGGFITSNTQLTDPLNPTDRSFRAVRTESNPNLRPEGATATTFGIEVKPVTGLKLSADFWRYDFADLIIRRNPQAVLSANPNDPRIIRSTAIGRPITRVETDWFNAASVKTDGIDFSGRYTANLGSGSLVLGVDGSYIHKFDIDNGLSAAIIRGVGNRNFTNSLSATPRWRVNGQVGWSNDRHNATLVGRYISSYTDDDPRAVDRDIGSWTVFDLNYALKLDGVAKGARLGAGVMNLFDRDPPTVDSSFLGYDTETHDPRGRIFQASIGFDF